MNFNKLAKKIYKSGLFKNIKLSKNYLSYSDCFNNMYVVQIDRSRKFPYIRIGHVESWIKQAPTYESEYHSLGDVKKSEFIDHIKPEQGTNPDYFLRISLTYLGVTI